MDKKHSRIKLAIEGTVTEACRLQGRGLWFGVDQVEVIGRPIERVKVWATLRFLAEGAPFCCGESGCQLGLFGDRRAELEDQIRLELNLSNAAQLDFRVGVQYEAGVTFRSHSE